MAVEATSVDRTGEAAARRARILIVDDEASMRELLEIVLRREGYDVSLAGNGAAAVAALESESFDLLISDIKMPDMSGVEVLRAARRLDPEMMAIMITAYASTESAVEAMRLGACDYLCKPSRWTSCAFASGRSSRARGYAARTCCSSEPWGPRTSSRT